MSKKKYYKKENPIFIRNQLKAHYLLKFRNLFYTSYKWEGLADDEIKFIMRKFWYEGRIAIGRIKNTEEHFLAPYSPQMFNIYDLPSSVLLINKYGVPFIPNTIQIVDEDVVIGYVSPLMLPITELIAPLIDKLVNAEMKIRTNLAISSIPFILAVEDADKEAVETMMNGILSDELTLYMNSADVNALKGMPTGAQLQIMELYKYKQQMENEILTLLGIDNIGGIEKAERLVVSEANANNELISLHGRTYLDEMQAFCERAREFLGINISVDLNKIEIENEILEENEGGEEYDE